MKNTTVLSIIRWTARIVGTLIVFLTLFIGIGEMLEGHGKPVSNPFNTLMIITFVIWGLGLAGLLLALWKEGIGGIISLFCFIIFNILVATNPNQESRYSFVLLVFMIPSVLYLCYWWLARKSSIKTS
jgi:bacteriorhodopsin